MAIRTVNYKSGYVMSALELNKLLNTIIAHINNSEHQIGALFGLHEGLGNLVVLKPHVKTLAQPIDISGTTQTVSIPIGMKQSDFDSAFLIFRNSVLLTDSTDYDISGDDIHFAEVLDAGDHLDIIKVYGLFDEATELANYIPKQKFNDLLATLKINTVINEEQYNSLKV